MPLKLIVILLSCFFTISPAILIIDPAGDARTPGRCIDDTFERGLTLQCAQEIKRTLETGESPIRTSLTRVAGEQISELHNIQFANRIKPNLYVSIHFFQETAVIPRVYIYTYDNGVKKKSASSLTFHPISTIHALYLDESIAAAQITHALFTSPLYSKKFQCSPPLALPYTPLMGIAAPAIAIEIGLKTKNDWQQAVQPLCTIIRNIIGCDNGNE